ncbi:MAG TPA: hypothetical protein DGG95_12275 [Cytophagales bacterium]|jgi:glycine oxidase|nr:hypothetical protein [Cytophagales bacterium]
MHIKTSVDHIIVGQGLAGSCLALQLLWRGKKIVVFDLPEKNRASTIAAGLFNPVTGKRLSQSWKANELFPYLFEFYSKAEAFFQCKFFHPMPIYRPFDSVQEQNEWMAKSAENGTGKFIENIFTTPTFTQSKDPLGGLLTRHSGYLNVNLFLSEVRKVLVKENAFVQSHFHERNLEEQNDGVIYQQVKANSIIFCDGLQALKNQLFEWLPIRPLRGETLVITLSQKPELIFNRGVYIVPTDSENKFMVGATYEPTSKTEEITVASRSELKEKLNGLLNMPFEIVGQNWGFRPTTPDRRPILGVHPDRPRTLVFNGLGTKGVSLAPYFSHLMAEWMDAKTELPLEINIERFKALYSKFGSE